MIPLLSTNNDWRIFRHDEMTQIVMCIVDCFWTNDTSFIQSDSGMTVLKPDVDHAFSLPTPQVFIFITVFFSFIIHCLIKGGQ